MFCISLLLHLQRRQLAACTPYDWTCRVCSGRWASDRGRQPKDPGSQTLGSPPLTMNIGSCVRHCHECISCGQLHVQLSDSRFASAPRFSSSSAPFVTIRELRQRVQLQDLLELLGMEESSQRLEVSPIHRLPVEVVERVVQLLPASTRRRDCLSLLRVSKLWYVGVGCSRKPGRAEQIALQVLASRSHVVYDNTPRQRAACFWRTVYAVQECRQRWCSQHGRPQDLSSRRIES